MLCLEFTLHKWAAVKKRGLPIKAKKLSNFKGKLNGVIK